MDNSVTARTALQWVMAVQLATPVTGDWVTQQSAELQNIRDTHPQAWRRERAPALLNIAAGRSPLQVAQPDLLKPRDRPPADERKG